jgi:hypothetical protein
MAGAYIYAVTSDIEPALEQQFNDWYNSEHVVELLAVPGFLVARRFRAINGNPKYLAVYNLEQPQVLNTYAFQRIRPTHPDSTPDCKRMWSHVKNWKRAAYEEQFATGSASDDADRAGFMFLAAYALDPSLVSEYTDWYCSEHRPAVSSVTGVMRTRIFQLHPEMLDHLLGDPPRQIVLYDLAGPEVCNSVDWQRCQQSSWSKRMQRLSNTHMRNHYQRIFPI